MSSRREQPPRSAPGFRRNRFTRGDYKSTTLDLLGMASPYEYPVAVEPEPPLLLPELPDDDLGESFPTIATLPTTAGDGRREGGLVERLWAATETEDKTYAVADWGATTQLDYVRSRVRGVAVWPILILVLMIGTALLVWNLRSIPRAQAEEIAADWRVSVVDLQAEVPNAQAAAGVITNPTSSIDQMAAARAELIGFDTSAASLEAVLTRPFPTPPPLASGDAFDPLKPIQDELFVATDLVEQIDDNLADAITYRNLLENAFRLPTLALSADGGTIEQLSVALASEIAATRSAVRQLPLNDSFDTHRQIAQSVVTRLDSWQAAYLEALRLGDIDATTELISEMSTRIEGVRFTLGEPLAAVAETIAASFAELEAILDDSLTDLGA
jgi:hypothetical protein